MDKQTEELTKKLIEYLESSFVERPEPFRPTILSMFGRSPDRRISFMESGSLVTIDVVHAKGLNKIEQSFLNLNDRRWYLHSMHYKEIIESKGDASVIRKIFSETKKIRI